MIPNKDIGDIALRSMNNTTKYLTAETNDYYVSAMECKRFVLESCYGGTKGYMYFSIALLLLLVMTMYRYGAFDKEIGKVKALWKKIRSKK